MFCFVSTSDMFHINAAIESMYLRQDTLNLPVYGSISDDNNKPECMREAMIHLNGIVYCLVVHVGDACAAVLCYYCSQSHL